MQCNVRDSSYNTPIKLNKRHETDFPHISQTLCWSRGLKFNFQFKWCVLWFIFPIPYFHSCAAGFVLHTHSRLSCWIFWCMNICDMLMGVIFIQPSCSSFFQQIWLLLLQYSKLPFHCQEEIGFSISRCFFLTRIFLFHWFLGWHLGWRVSENHSAHGQLHPPASPCNLQGKGCSHRDGIRVIPLSGSKPWALAECWEQGVCGSGIWSAN